MAQHYIGGRVNPNTRTWGWRVEYPIDEDDQLATPGTTIWGKASRIFSDEFVARVFAAGHDGCKFFGYGSWKYDSLSGMWSNANLGQ